MSRPVLALLLMSVAACAAWTGQPVLVLWSGVVLPLGQPVRISGGQLTVSFEAVVDDSRCPVGATCIWEGDATVRLRVEGGSTQSATYELHTFDGRVREIVHGDVRLRVTALTPVPAADKKTRPDEYRLTLSVTRK